jgi:hypothetical protein
MTNRRETRGSKSRQAKETTPKGAIKLSEAANKALLDDSKDIAQALVKSCKEGHIQSIKFLYELSGLATELGHAEGAIKFRNLAAELAAQPEWSEELAEEDDDTAAVCLEQ